jgi:hypothetical protein
MLSPELIRTVVGGVSALLGFGVLAFATRQTKPAPVHDDVTLFPQAMTNEVFRCCLHDLRVCIAFNGDRNSDMKKFIRIAEACSQLARYNNLTFTAYVLPTSAAYECHALIETIMWKSTRLLEISNRNAFTGSKLADVHTRLDQETKGILGNVKSRIYLQTV